MERDLVDGESIDGLLRASPVFAGLGADARDLVGKELTAHLARRGEVLMRQGEPADSMYLVASGRLQVRLVRADGTDTAVAEVGRGELVGEMALLTDSPRSATVVALRDSHLLRLSTDAFARVVHAHPDAQRTTATALIDKLMRTLHQGPATSPARSIAVVPLDGEPDTAQFAFRLARALGRGSGDVPVVTEGDAPDAATGDGATSGFARAVWREEREAAHEIIVYVTAIDPTPWSRECIERADVIVLAGSAHGPARLRPIEELAAHLDEPFARRTELVLLHPPSTVTPRGTRRFLDPRGVDRHHHVRTDREADYERVARLLTGRGIGVVFSGGGARGIAHVGVLRALRAAGVPIDATAGSSIGAIVGGAVARGDTPEEVGQLLRAAVVERSPVDLTLPAVSLAMGERVTQHIRQGAQGLDIEDAWLPFCCVSTNLTRGTVELHRRGPGWKAVRSSFAVPGLFPPMHNDAGDVLVDGGVLDNLPVSSLRSLHAGISVVGVDVGTHREFALGAATAEGAVSGWRFVASNLRRRTLDELMVLPRVLLRLTELGATASDDRGDCYIRPGLDGVSLLDFDRFEDLVAIGERDAEPVVREWLATRA